MSNVDLRAGQDEAERWLKLAPKPRARGPGIKWDVFVSYRSINRTWALALYDTLREAGYEVFLDQFVLPAGAQLQSFLRDNLRASASGVVLWSKDSASSDYVRGEFEEMRQLRKTRKDFAYVLAKLDREDPPFLAQEDLYVDFAGYPEGPRGGDLLRLMFGLGGQPLTAAAIREIQELDTRTADIVRDIGAARAVGNPAKLLALAQDRSFAMVATSFPLSLLGEALIALGLDQEALNTLTEGRRLFPQAIRLKQLTALALRHLGQIEPAQEIMAGLYNAGHRDPESLGLFAASWVERWKRDKKRLHLERALHHYREAFTLDPESYYCGINTAATLALLGQLDAAAAVAATVKPLVEGADGGDYWRTATLGEACLLGGDVRAAVKHLRFAVVAHSAEPGSIASTRGRISDLLGVLPLSDADKATVANSLSLQ